MLKPQRLHKAVLNNGFWARATECCQIFLLLRPLGVLWPCHQTIRANLLDSHGGKRRPISISCSSSDFYTWYDMHMPTLKACTQTHIVNNLLITSFNKICYRLEGGDINQVPSLLILHKSSCSKSLSTQNCWFFLNKTAHLLRNWHYNNDVISSFILKPVLLTQQAIQIQNRMKILKLYSVVSHYFVFNKALKDRWLLSRLLKILLGQGMQPNW